MRRATLLHPRMSARLDGHFTQSVDILESTETRSASGQVVDDYAPVPELRNLPCALQPRHTTQDRTSGEIVRYMRSTHRIEINGYYPEITNEMLAQINGENWKIEAVEFDSLESLTELFVWVRS